MAYSAHRISVNRCRRTAVGPPSICIIVGRETCVGWSRVRINMPIALDQQKRCAHPLVVQGPIELEAIKIDRRTAPGIALTCRGGRRSAKGHAGKCHATGVDGTRNVGWQTRRWLTGEHVRQPKDVRTPALQAREINRPPSRACQNPGKAARRAASVGPLQKASSNLLSGLFVLSYGTVASTPVAVGRSAASPP